MLTDNQLKLKEMKVTKEVLDYTRSHTKRDSYLYNNRLFFSNLITKEEYNLNRLFIKNFCSWTMNTVKS